MTRKVIHWIPILRPILPTDIMRLYTRREKSVIDFRKPRLSSTRIRHKQWKMPQLKSICMQLKSLDLHAPQKAPMFFIWLPGLMKNNITNLTHGYLPGTHGEQDKMVKLKPGKKGAAAPFFQIFKLKTCAVKQLFCSCLQVLLHY